MKKKLALVLSLCMAQFVQAGTLTVNTNGPRVPASGMGFRLQVEVFPATHTCNTRIFTIEGTTSSTRIDIGGCGVSKVIVTVLDGRLKGLTQEVVPQTSRGSSYVVDILDYGDNIVLKMAPFVLSSFD